MLTSLLLISVIILSWSSELSLSVSDTGPVFNDLFLLSSHFDEESSVEDFFITMIPNEVDGIDSHFENDFKWSRIIIFYFDELEIGEGFFDVFFGGIEVTLDKIEGDMLNIFIKVFDLLNKFVFGGDRELFSFLLLVVFHFL